MDYPGTCHDQRNTSGMLEEVHLVPKTALTQHVAMVSSCHHDCVVQLPDFIERLNDLPDLAVEIADIRQIGPARPTHFFVGERHVRRLHPIHQPTRERILIFQTWNMLGKLNLFISVKVPPFRPCHVRVVRMYEAGDQSEWRFLARSPVPRDVEQPSSSCKTNLVIVVDLKRGLRNAAFLDGPHVVVPLVDPLIRGFPIRRPCEVRRVNVGRHAIFKSVHLIRADEMHLSGQARPVTQCLQIMSESRNRRFELRGIVIGCDPADQLPGHESEPGWRAKRRIAVGRIEAHSPCGQRIQMRRLGNRMPVCAGKLRSQLIRHDNDDIGARHAEPRA